MISAAELPFRLANAFHDMISQMGKNALADKISRVVRTLTCVMRCETVAAMINIVLATYFEDTIHDALQSEGSI